MSKVILDTNILLNNDFSLDDFENVFLPTQVLEELDGLKKSDGEVGFKARKAMQILEQSDNVQYIVQDEYNMPAGWDLNKRDNQIVMCAKENDCKLISNDLNVRIKAQSIGVECEGYDKNNIVESYSGYKEVYLDTNNNEDNELLSHLYECPEDNIFNLNINEYIIIYDKARPIYDEDYNEKIGYQVVDKLRWNGLNHAAINTKPLNSHMLGKLKALDDYQLCAIDSLMNNNMTMIKGKAGSGKTLIALSYALNMIERGKYSKLIAFTNPVASKNSARLGFYPGTRDEKLLDSSVGSMLESKFGDKMAVQMLISQNKLMLMPFSDIRGFDSTGMNAIIWISEAQNLDIELMRLAIQRVGEDCKIIIDGDYNAQVDMNCFDGSNNGMKRVSEVFRGQDFYGEVELRNIYRSKMAKIADLL